MLDYFGRAFSDGEDVEVGVDEVNYAFDDGDCSHGSVEADSAW